jgi:hypothetical protein
VEVGCPSTDDAGQNDLNPMIPANVAIGGLIIVHCLFLLVIERWFLARTAKGQWLIRKFGVVSGPWVFRGLTLTAMVIGALLAAGVIRPIQW